MSVSCSFSAQSLACVGTSTPISDLPSVTVDAAVTCYSLIRRSAFNYSLYQRSRRKRQPWFRCDTSIPQAYHRYWRHLRMAHRPSTSEITPAVAPQPELTQDRPIRPYYVRPRPPSSRQTQPVVTRGEEDVGMSIGWLCFFAGFICLFPWLFGFCLSFISANKNDKRVRYWNLAAFLIVTSIYIAVWRAYED